ncbi:MAG: L,D-transpeptidase [Christensenellales bacterium]
MGVRFKSKAAKVLFISILAVIVAGLAIYMLWPGLLGKTGDVSTSPVATVEAVASPTPSPSPTQRQPYIPDPLELQEIPAISALSLTENYIVAMQDNGILKLSWPADANSDYYVLCVLDGQNIILQRDILHAEISEWELADFQGVSILLVSYKDMGEDGAADDDLVGAYYTLIVVPPTPSPTPTVAAPTPKKTTAGASTPRPSATAAPAAPVNKYYIIVDKADNAFAIFELDEHGAYTNKVKSFSCGLGRSGRLTPTGKFTISSKGTWKTWYGGEYSPFYTRYTSGLYFHGPIYTAKRGDAMIPGSYNEIGSNVTSGCVRTTVAGARWVYYNCPAGTVVEIVSSSGLVSNPGKPSIDPNYPTWDPTDPDKPDAPPSPTATEAAASPTAAVSTEPPASPSADPSPSPSADPSSSPSSEPSVSPST